MAFSHELGLKVKGQRSKVKGLKSKVEGQRFQAIGHCHQPLPSAIVTSHASSSIQTLPLF